MKLHYKAFDLHLNDTFKIAHDQRDVQHTLIVGLEHQGRMGFGEATASKYYQRPVASIIEVLEKNRHRIEETPFDSLELFIESLHAFFQGNNFALCALDVAAHDLYGKLNGFPIHQYWSLDTSWMPLTNYTIGIDELTKMESKIKAFPWPVYKIKLGTDDDLSIVKALRKITDAVFRVDANCAWTAAQTIEYAKSFKELGVEFIEQPLEAGDWEGMAEVYKHSTLPMMADESCIEMTDVARCKGYFHGVNIKLMKCGGLLVARKMIAQAQSLGLKVMVGCMTESSVGISAISQLLPLLDYVDMDGPLLICNDIASGPGYHKGKVMLSPENGTGVVMHTPWI
ncbi:dipeptide epimerase [Cyclobacteriaceae bacterium]|jgi:L-alanine-DL-glutamate epimerase-like enolase superfamily enzyme|nr:dipeptide epimerase [Cyclobacteriaceae bacterium]